MKLSDLITIDNILLLIRENKDFRKAFVKIANTIVDKIYSFTENPNCTCKSSIIEWIEKNETSMINLVKEKEKDQSLSAFMINRDTVVKPKVAPIQSLPDIKKGIKEPVQVTQTASIPAPAPSPVPSLPLELKEKITAQENAPQVVSNMQMVVGEIYEISPHPDEYKQLLKTALEERWIFRGLTVVPSKNDENVDVWLVFFY